MPTHYERTVSGDPTSEDQILANLIGKGASVLELGCHSGYFSEYLIARGNTVVGLDNDPDAVRIAQDRGVEASARNLEDAAVLQDERGFDVILAANVLEHLRSPELLLREALGAITERGRLVVSVPNVAHYRIRLMLLRGQFHYEDHGIMDRTHLRFFTRNTLQELLRASGWTITQEAHSPGLIDGRIKSRLQRWLVAHYPSLASQHLIAEAVPSRFDVAHGR